MRKALSRVKPDDSFRSMKGSNIRSYESRLEDITRWHIYFMNSKENANSKTLIGRANSLITKKEKKLGNKNMMKSGRKNGDDKRQTANVSLFELNTASVGMMDYMGLTIADIEGIYGKDYTVDWGTSGGY